MCVPDVCTMTLRVIQRGRSMERKAHAHTALINPNKAERNSRGVKKK